jgi:hypothetical protein
MTEAVFVADGDALVPTELAAGPWDPQALHGGPAAAIMARAIETVETEVPMSVVRLTCEFMRPVPRAPLHVRAEVQRPARRVQLVRASIEASGAEVAAATALRIRREPLDLSGLDLPVADTVAAPETGRAYRTDEWFGFGGAMEVRVVAGGIVRPGPVTAWFRLRKPMVAGEEPTPLMRVVAAADFGNGVSRVLDFTRHLFINPDLTVYLHRSPRGEWVCLDASTDVTPDGIGLAHSRLYDEAGPIGHSLQGLLLGARA